MTRRRHTALVLIPAGSADGVTPQEILKEDKDMEPKRGQRVALVTGGAGGLGAAFAERLAADGLAIGIIDIKPGETTAEKIISAGGQARAFQCDITDPKAVEDLSVRIAEVFGRCDVLINNAGRYDAIPFGDLTLERWRSIIALNLDGAFLMAKAFIPGMAARGWGRIVNICSYSFWRPMPGIAAYVASKAGSIGLIRALANEYGKHGITANAVAPGTIETEQLRSAFSRDFGDASEQAFSDFTSMVVAQQSLSRPGTTGDIAEIVSFLASDAASFVTGQTMIADGGTVFL